LLLVRRQTGTRFRSDPEEEVNMMLANSTKFLRPAIAAIAAVVFFMALAAVPV
jgi:hypothetical protein